MKTFVVGGGGSVVGDDDGYDDSLSYVAGVVGVAGEIDADYVDADGVSSSSDNVGVGVGVDADADDSPAGCADGIGTVETFVDVAAVSLSGVAVWTFVVAAATVVTAVTIVAVVQIDHDYCYGCDRKSRTLQEWLVVNVVVVVIAGAAIVVMSGAAIVAAGGGDVKSVKRRWKDYGESFAVV